MFSNLPQAVLGAVVVDAALGLIHFKVASRFASTSRRDFSVFVATAVGLFFVGVVAGIFFGVVVSLLLLVARTSRSPVHEMAYDEVDQVYVEAASHPEATKPDGEVVVKVNGPLFFADAAPFQASLLRLVSDSDAHAVIVDLEATPEIDLDAADMMSKVHQQLADKGVPLLLAHADTAELDMLRRTGTLGEIGDENLFETVRSAVAATRT